MFGILNPAVSRTTTVLDKLASLWRGLRDSIDSRSQPLVELKVHFSDIHRVITDHLSKADTDIAVAVDWFSDRELFEVLCKKAGAGLNVKVALIDTEANRGGRALNFRKLEDCGGQVTFIPAGIRDSSAMRQKFCVIDRATVITGSYDWSGNARRNDENVTVITDSAVFASEYLQVFDGIISRAGLPPQATQLLDAETVRHRLAIIRSLILLGEREEVAPHLQKLGPSIAAQGLGDLLAALEDGQYKKALSLIDDFLHRATAIVVADETRIVHLRFELRDLEVRLESLGNEKGELERQLLAFNRLHDEALGDVLQCLLKLRAEIARLEAEQKREPVSREQAEVHARHAHEEHANYSRQRQRLRSEATPAKLDADAERELKTLYRKACRLCHPDKFPEERKAAAHLVFTELQAAYRLNELDRVREIYSTLASGGLPKARSSSLRVVDELLAAVAELEHAIARATGELKAFYESASCKLMREAGSTEASWQTFFAHRRSMIEDDLLRLGRRAEEPGGKAAAPHGASAR